MGLVLFQIVSGDAPISTSSLSATSTSTTEISGDVPSANLISVSFKHVHHRNGRRCSKLPPHLSQHFFPHFLPRWSTGLDRRADLKLFNKVRARVDSLPHSPFCPLPFSTPIASRASLINLKAGHHLDVQFYKFLLSVVWPLSPCQLANIPQLPGWTGRRPGRKKG